jgi:hypothetical protein
MASFTDYLYDFSVNEVLKLYSGRSFISQRILREVRDHITTRIVQGEQIDADDRASYDRLKIQVILQGKGYLIIYCYLHYK